MCRDKNEDENRSFGSFWNLYMYDEQTDPLMYHFNEGLVRSSQALSRTNENFRLQVRFRFRPGT